MINNFVGAEFEKAQKVEFWSPADINKEPGAVILIFEEQQIRESNVRGCYNYLLSVGDVRTTSLQIRKVKDKVDITIFDKERNFEIPVKGLTFSDEQFKTFVKNYPKKISFAFLLGMDAPDSDRPVLIPSKEPFEILTLGGYKIKK